MPFNPEDPKWTAYVLNELDASERASVDLELAESLEARQLVGEIRKTTHVLESELKAELAPLLLSEQKMLIEQQIAPMPRSDSGIMRRYTTWAATAAVAASLLLLAGISWVNRIYTAKATNQRKIEYRVASPETKGVDDTKSNEIAYTVGKPTFEKAESTAPQSGSGEVTADFDSLSDLITSTTKPETWSAQGQPVTHPDEAEWTEFTRRRKKYSLSDQAKGEVDLSVVPDANVSGVANSSRLHSLAKDTDDVDEYSRGWYGEGQLEGRSHSGWGNRYELGAESYDSVTDNPFFPARENPLSTFSIDVDTASYSNIRRFLTQNNSLPPKGAVRIEEMINYFRYDYPEPEGDVPFSVTTEVAGCPWNAGHRLVRIGLKGREISPKKRPPSNLVFLIDVSGSMTDANKLPMVRESMKLLAEQLTENDLVAIVVYAGNSGLVLPPTTGDKQREIRDAIDRLDAGGSTNGGEGIQLAYDLAAGNFIKGGTNRVILATDGDFNVGITNRDDLIKLITEKAKSGVFLTTLGFGMGNLKDATLEQLAGKGNGNYAYIDDLREAKKVFVEQMNGTLITIAKDVKIQIEFNPADVASYRLIGYENRILAHQDFNDDKKDAGEIGSGHTVTALYEIAPAAGDASEGERPAVDPLKYQKPKQPVNEEKGKGELLTLKLRYKQPDGDTSKLIETPVVDSGQPYGKATADFKFSASVALFGMILRDSPHNGTGTLDAAAELATEGLGKDEGGYRTEFLQLIKQAKEFAKR